VDFHVHSGNLAIDLRAENELSVYGRSNLRDTLDTLVLDFAIGFRVARTYP